MEIIFKLLNIVITYSVCFLYNSFNMYLWRSDNSWVITSTFSRLLKVFCIGTEVSHVAFLIASYLCFQFKYTIEHQNPNKQTEFTLL